jgi:hypothetical protein
VGGRHAKLTCRPCVVEADRLRADEATGPPLEALKRAGATVEVTRGRDRHD